MAELFSNPLIWVWLVLIVVFLVVEGVSTSLVSIWFAAGAAVGLIVAALHLPLWFQIFMFLLASGVLLVATKPFVRRMLSKNTAEKTNADRAIGQTALVTTAIDNLKGQGQAEVAGQLWTARSVDGSVIPAGETVEVVEISGVKLMVKRREEQE